MKHTKKSATLGLAIIAAMAGGWTKAGEDGWYVGGSVGQSGATIDDERIVNGLTAGGLATTSISDDDTDTGFKLFGAYQFNQHFAVEGGVYDLGGFGFRAVTVPLGTLAGNIKVRGMNADVVGIWPFTDKFSAFARVGANYADVKDSFAGTGAVGVLIPSAKEAGLSYKAGVGLEYDFTSRIGMRVEGERYRIDDAVGNMSDIDLLSLGLVVRFGKSEKREDREEPAEAAVTSAVTAPLLVIVPAKVKTGQYCSILALTFEINTDEIQREDKEKLAVVGTFMNKYPETTAVIEGHSDNVGAARHNLYLSQQRADNVANYLIETFRIDRDRMQAVGYGDTSPIADNRTEEGKRANRRIDALIACATDIEGLPVAPARTTMALDMQFDANSAEVKPEYAGELRKVASFLKANPKVTATVEGHTDNLKGTYEQVQQMSERRALSVVDYLVKTLGVSQSQLAAQGYGKTRRFAYNTTAEGRQENRRVNIVFNYAK